MIADLLGTYVEVVFVAIGFLLLFVRRVGFLLCILAIWTGIIINAENVGGRNATHAVPFGIIPSAALSALLLLVKYGLVGLFSKCLSHRNH